jgi:hypothetical protein
MSRVRRQKEIDEQAVLGVGMKEKAAEFVAAGADIYQSSGVGRINNCVPAAF